MALTDNMVDANATSETKQLFLRLHAAAQSGTSLIGMDSSTRYGEFLRTEPGGPKDWSVASGADRTDIGDLCGQHPSIYGIDIADIVGDWCGLGQDNDERQRQREQSREETLSHMQAINERGGVITLHYHMNNPIDDEPFNSKQSPELWQLVVPSECDDQLPENSGAMFDQLREKIDSLIDFLQDLVDADGNLIPIIFRPLHENNGNWFWWCIPEDVDFEVYVTAYRRVWKWLVWYIHDYRDYHAMLWATGPNGGLDEEGLTSSEAYWRTLPDPMFVDILGYDRYTDYSAEDGLAVQEVRFVVEEAERLGKIAAVTEAGFSFQGDSSLWPDDVWTNRVIGPIKNDPVATRVAWILLWHNFPNDDDEGGEYFGPHKNHSSAEDFLQVSVREDILLETEFREKEFDIAEE